MCFVDFQSYNEIYGMMKNLYDFECILGGLLGGLVVVLVVGMIGFEMGFDIGGLICNLVYFCGVFGYKLMWNLLLLCGYVFLGVLMLFDILVIGLMGCFVVDLCIGMDVMVGFNEIEGCGYQLVLCSNGKLVFEWKVVVWVNDVMLLVSVVVQECIYKVVKMFESFGVSIDDIVCFDFFFEEVYVMYQSLF